MSTKDLVYNTMKNRSGNVLDSDRIGPLLLKLALPAFFGMFVQALYNVVSAIFIGHFVGSLALAGLSAVFPLQMLAMGVGMMVGMGGASVISRFLGTGNLRGAERAIGNGISVGIVAAIIITIVILAPVTFWLRLIGASDDVMPFARDYLVIIISFSLFNVMAMSLLNFARAEGNARVGMIGMMMGAILNIILDAIFIVGLHWGVKGAGLATGISQTVSMIYIVSYYLTGNSYLKIRLRNLLPDFSILKSMFSVGIASFVQSMAGSISAMLIIHHIVIYGGDVALGAFGIIQRIMLFAMMPALVIAQGSQPIIGFNYGAKRFGLILKTIRLAGLVSSMMCILIFLLLYFIPRPIMSIFTNDPELLKTGAQAAKLVFLALPLIGLIMLGTTMFQAIGKGFKSFITAIVRPVVFLLPSVIVLSRAWQLDGVFLSFVSADLMTFFLIIILTIPILRGFQKAAAATDSQGKSTTTPMSVPKAAPSSQVAE